MAAPLQPKQRVRSESAAGTGTGSVKGKSALARLAPKRSGWPVWLLFSDGFHLLKSEV
jgi:hypothetical protein